ncbi:histidyl-tRNA synthetase [Lapidilactobacillus dextrinicus DSM 20335]|uniref:Histidine--tRNA ligase n=1 Tax=Lapidilactobacillus dextrinicus DSM 20335 TaxID=1423738 RepID=A0A0R2BUA1_9LACO|nr:histidine--tRNA ligase [Lapidilactobacillus dextrinicus]KRM79324.1 histidyl-tRNA synthetase [Lapidilactobacillus dextrinicus DSM 20335]QFG46841.1 histidine--tRNA ligase [Lapidilactobacillus dextrinicus]
MHYQKPKGTADILPAEAKKWQYVENIAQEVFETYNYHEIRTPIFESYDVFERSSGESSDVVSKEMYDFHDKGDRHIALRPEGTAGVVRAYVENKLFGPEQVKPYKVYYHGPMFRYERPQSGRQRQFHQIGVEAFGSTSPDLDVETIAMAMQLLARLNLTDMHLVINSLGDAQTQEAYHQALVDYLTPLKDELSADSKRRLTTNPLRILDSKDAHDQELVAQAPTILDFLSEDSAKHFEAVKAGLTSLGIDYEVDNTMVRGLDYYTNTIFEIMVTSPAFNNTEMTAIGGGRYDGLVKEFGGPDEPGIGFGIGVERLLLLLDSQAAALQAKPLDFYIVKTSEAVEGAAFKLLQAIRQNGLSADQDYLARKVKGQFKNADRLHAQYVITVGETEVETGRVPVKDLATGEQVEIAIADFTTNFAGVLAKLAK